jgi:DNA-binding response OmpR family regulator
MSEKVLVIDDEPLILMTIEKALSKVGYEVKTTSDADDFLKILSAEGADLIIMDLHLGGVDTDALREKVKALSPHSKTLIISGFTQESNEIYFLQKPFKIDELRDKVRKILDTT